MDTRPCDSYLELVESQAKGAPSGYHLDHDSRPSSSYLDLHDEIPNAQPTQREIPNSEPTISTNPCEIYYDDTFVSPQSSSAWSNNPAQNGVPLQPQSGSTLHPDPNHLPPNGTARQGQPLPAPPPETSMRKRESFNSKYNTFSRRTRFQENTADHEFALRQLSNAGRVSSASSSCCCIRCRDVVWLILGLLMTAACIAGCYFSTHSVVSKLCQANGLNLGQVRTVVHVYGEVEFQPQNTTVILLEQRLKSDMENSMRHSILSFFLKNITVLGFSKGSSDSRLTSCRFILSFRVDESKSMGLEDFVRRLLEEKFIGHTLDGATLRCIVIPKLNEASAHECPEATTSAAVTSSAITMT